MFTPSESALVERQVSTAIHQQGNRILNARKQIRRLGVERERLENTFEEMNHVLAAFLFMVVMFGAIFDLMLSGPGLADRFSEFGLPEDMAWGVAVVFAIVLLSIEVVLAARLSEHREKGAASGNWWPFIGCVICAVVLLSVPVGLAYSQYETWASGADEARQWKELSFGAFVLGFHLVLLSSGKSLFLAKEVVMRRWRMSKIESELASLEKQMAKCWEKLSGEFRRYLMLWHGSGVASQVPAGRLFEWYETDVRALLVERWPLVMAEFQSGGQPAVNAVTQALKKLTIAR